jgi:diguanylate cyclase (GGDEF)-like protein/PAS domain S-box-containing protein
MPGAFAPNPKQNRILAALTPNDFARLQDDLECVPLKLGQVLFESGDNLGHVYFPTTCIVSLIFTTRKGASAELAITGNDGLVGIPLVLGGETTTHRAVIQSEGIAFRLKLEVMRWELDQGGELQHLALRYTQALMTQMAQSVVCNRHHAVDQQLCRWLLLSLDRLPGNQLNMTQELIANMLGVRREAVTEAAGKLQAAGLIHYSRGHITLIDRAGLEARACECYAVVKAEYDRLFQFPANTRSKNRIRPNPETLRKRAEARLQQSSPETLKTAWDNAQLVHELQVHQIELEMHNDELRQAYDEADALIERYADIYDFAPISYFTLDKQGVIVDMNLAGSILLGIKGSQKGRHRFASRVAPADLPAFDHFFEQVLQARNKTVGEFVLAATHHRAEATVTIEAVPDENGEECRMVVIDVSPARQAQKALQEREQYLRTVLDNLPFMAWLKDKQSNFITVNAPLAAHVGWPSADALTGRNDFDITTPELAESYQAEDRAVLESGQTWNQVQLTEKNGEQRWHEINKSPIKLGDQTIGTVGFSRDITEHYRIEQALKNSESHHRRLIEGMPLAIAIIQDAVIKYINPQGLELLGYPADECIDHPFLQLVQEDDRPALLSALPTRSPEQHNESGCEIRLVSKDGAVIDCLMHQRVTEWQKKTATLATFENITSRKQLERELRRLACLDPLTQLASRAHFLIHLEQSHSRLKRGIEDEVAVLRIDLDHFNANEDALSRLGEEALLRIFSGLLRDELRQIDFAGRLGPQQFAILLAATDLPAARAFAQRLLAKLAGTTISLGGRQQSICISVGLATINENDASGEEGLQRADQALCQAQAAGGNQFATWENDTSTGTP